jgi:hypothetical protein
MICLFVLPAAYAQQGTKPDYASLLEKVKKSDRAADFTGLRMAYFDSPPANSKEADPKVIQAMFAALSDKKYDKVIESGQQVLNGCFVNIDAHIALAAAYQGKKDANKEKFHAWVADGLMKSIVSSGDGKSKATAWTVISTDEEYVILRSFGLTPGTQSLLSENGHYYDRLDATDPQSKKTFTLFFNIDRPYGKLSKLLK